MKQPVLLAEKPSQARDYANAYDIESKKQEYIVLKPSSALPNGLIVTWAIGHILELKPPKAYDNKFAKWDMDNLPIFPDNFQYQVTNDMKDRFKSVKDLLKNAPEIWIGTDAGREGELIAREIFDYIGIQNTPIKRLWINSMEKEEIRRGINNLYDGNKTYGYSLEAQARQQADWLIGMNLSPLFSLLLQNQGYKGSLSIGRVQSPTLYLVYNRQKEIENFQSQSFYEIEGTFQTESGEYKGEADIKEYDKQKVQDILDYYNIAGQQKGNIQSVETKEKRHKSPKLHSLSTLQTKANKRWKMSPKTCLNIVQQLYDKKLLSYPRTDCNYITEHEFTYLVNNVAKYQSMLNVSFEPDTSPKKGYVDSSKVGEHYAIIPTRTFPKMEQLSENEKNVYEEVLATTLAMFHDDFIYDETTIITNVNNLLFYSKGKTIKNNGWKSLFSNKPDQEKVKHKENEQQLPSLNKYVSVHAEVAMKEGKTNPPKAYTEGHLLNAMIKCGKNVDDEEDTKILKSTEGIGTEATRSNIIEQLKIKKYIEIKNNTVFVTKKGEILCQAIEGTLLSSPSMTAKWESFLNYIGDGSKTKEQFLNRIQQFIQKIITEMPDNIKSKQIITDKIEEQQQQNEITKCPSCSGSIEDKGKFYGCSGYKSGCKVTFPKKLAGKNLTSSTIRMLCAKGKTNELKGFKSKKNKTFKTRLALNSDYKIEFDFSDNKS